MILLVRHGETEWNVERRFQGSADSPLTERGRRQAAAMAGLIRDLVAREPHPAWRLISSPLGRAHDTARTVAAAVNLPVELDARIAEIGCGAWEGRRFDDVAAEHAHLGDIGNWISNSPGGERHEDIAARIGAFLEGLPPEPERRTIVVSHGAAGRILRGTYMGLGREAMLDLEIPQDAVFRLQNGQIDRFDCEPLD
jgi:broad specificity phosphatase PhoE